MAILKHLEEDQHKVLLERLNQSEHKRQECIQKITLLQGRLQELTTENTRLKQRFKEMIVKKANTILKEEFDLLEKKYTASLKEVNRLLEASRKLKNKIQDGVEAPAKAGEDKKLIEAYKDESDAMQQQLANYKMLVREMRH